MENVGFLFESIISDEYDREGNIEYGEYTADLSIVGIFSFLRDKVTQDPFDIITQMIGINSRKTYISTCGDIPRSLSLLISISKFNLGIEINDFLINSLPEFHCCKNRNGDDIKIIYMLETDEYILDKY